MSVRLENNIQMEKDKNGNGLDTAWVTILDGNTLRGLSIYFNHRDTGHGFGCDVHHGITYHSTGQLGKASRISHYKYFRGCPEKYLPLVKLLEKVLRA